MALGIAPMPVWIVASSGIRSATKAAIRSSISVRGGGGTSTSGRSTSTQPSTWLTWIWLRPNVRGCWALASRKKRARPMNDAT